MSLDNIHSGCHLAAGLALAWGYGSLALPVLLKAPRGGALAFLVAVRSTVTLYSGPKSVLPAPLTEKQIKSKKKRKDCC